MPPRLAATSTSRLFTSPVYYSSRSFRSSSQRLHTPESASTSEHPRTLEPSVDATLPGPAPSTSRSQWTKDISQPIPKKRLHKRKTEEAPAAKPSFTGLGLSMPIILTLKATFPNVREATEAQRRFIPAIVQGRQDVLLKGQTGSGKSFGIMLALMSKPLPDNFLIQKLDRRPITSLLLVPHADLAHQYLHWISRMVRAADPSRSIDSIAQVIVRGDSSADLDTQIAKLRTEPPFILIGTPQAIHDVAQKDPGALGIQYLSTVVVDEADFLIPSVPSHTPEKKREQLRRRIEMHPTLTKQLLDVVYRSRIRSDDGEDARTLRPLPQLVMCSATLNTGLRAYIAQNRWMKQGANAVVRISDGQEDSRRAEPEEEEEDEDERTARAHLGPNISHSVLIVSEDGQVKNIAGAVDESDPGEEEPEQDRHDLEAVTHHTHEPTSPETDSASQSLEKLPEDVVLRYEMTPSPYHAPSMETLAEIFAVNVPRVALLVLSASSSIPRAVYDIQALGVNARALDLLSPHGRDHLLRAQDSNGSSAAGYEAEPTLLVSNLAVIRGIDLPELSHVFLLGVPEAARKGDSYLHIAGRVGRFGRKGRVVTILRAEPYEEGGRRMSETREMRKLLQQIRVVPVKYDYVEQK